MVGGSIYFGDSELGVWVSDGGGRVEKVPWLNRICLALVMPFLVLAYIGCLFLNVRSDE